MCYVYIWWIGRAKNKQSFVLSEEQVLVDKMKIASWKKIRRMIDGHGGPQIELTNECGQTSDCELE